MIESEAKKMLQSTWEDLHQIPEVGTSTPKTCAYIAKRLREYGYAVDDDVAGGIVAILESGKEGPSFGLRADTDALEFFVNGEKTAYHGCCHDAHSSILLTVAKEMAESGIKKGRLYIVFQPGEEPSLGARAMVETGKLDHIEEIVALHMCPEADLPHGKIAALLMHHGLGTLKADIRGKNAHASLPQDGINAVEAGVLAVNAANTVRCDPTKSWSAKATQFIADRSADNTIPDYAQVVFDLRGESNEILIELSEKLKTAIAAAASAVGASAEFDFNFNPAPDYDEELGDFVAETIREELGQEHLIKSVPTGAGEDFHFFSYMRGIKTAYMAIGSAVTPALHIYQNSFDHDYLYISYRLLCAIAHKKLG